MATKKQTTKQPPKSNVLKVGKISSGLRFDKKIAAVLVLLLIVVVGYLFIRFSKASTGTQWLPKMYSNATEWDSPTEGYVVAQNCFTKLAPSPTAPDQWVEGTQGCNALAPSSGISGRPGFLLSNTANYVPGVTNWNTVLRHKVPAGLTTPSVYCITYSATQDIILKWSNRSAAYADYIIGGVAGSDTGKLPATGQKIATWCTGPYPAKAGSVFEIEPYAKEVSAYIYSVSSQTPEAKLSWNGLELTPTGSSTRSGTTIMVNAGTNPSGFKFVDDYNYGAGKYCYLSNGAAGGPTTKIEWVSQERRWDNDNPWASSPATGNTANTLIPAVKSATECITVPAVSAGDSPRRELSFQMTNGNTEVTKVTFTPASTSTVTPITSNSSTTTPVATVKPTTPVPPSLPPTTNTPSVTVAPPTTSVSTSTDPVPQPATKNKQ